MALSYHLRDNSGIFVEKLHLFYALSNASDEMDSVTISVSYLRRENQNLRPIIAWKGHDFQHTACDSRREERTDRKRMSVSRTENSFTLYPVTCSNKIISPPGWRPAWRAYVLLLLLFSLFHHLHLFNDCLEQRDLPTHETDPHQIFRVSRHIDVSRCAFWYLFRDRSRDVAMATNCRRQIGKIEKSPCLSNDFTDHYEIWHGDAFWQSMAGCRWTMHAFLVIGTN